MSNIELFGSDKVKNLVTDTLYGCDDGELYIDCLLYTSPSPRD